MKSAEITFQDSAKITPSTIFYTDFFIFLVSVALTVRAYLAGAFHVKDRKWLVDASSKSEKSPLVLLILRGYSVLFTGTILLYSFGQQYFDVEQNTSSGPWLRYLTHWSYLVLFYYFAIIARYGMYYRGYENRATMYEYLKKFGEPGIVESSIWIFYELTWSSAFLVVIGFWGFIGTSIYKDGRINLPFTTLAMHGMNLIAVTVELLLNKIPFSWRHLPTMIAYSSGYLLFDIYLFKSYHTWPYPVLDWNLHSAETVLIYNLLLSFGIGLTFAIGAGVNSIKGNGIAADTLILAPLEGLASKSSLLAKPSNLSYKNNSSSSSVKVKKQVKRVTISDEPIIYDIFPYSPDSPTQKAVKKPKKAGKGGKKKGSSGGSSSTESSPASSPTIKRRSNSTRRSASASVNYAEL